MARVFILKPREQAAHFGLYRTSAGGDEGIIVRRKVGEPTDYMHTKSRKLALQRTYLTLASQHYARLTPSQKAITRHQFEEVEYETGHSKTETKLLQGRQLFISKEMHSLKTTGKQTVLPHELCIMLVDENHLPLAGELWLYCTVSGEWCDLPKDEIYTGNWLFSLVPPDYPPYRPYGEAAGYFDPMLPEHQAMTEEEILPYHYHEMHLPVDQEDLHPNGDTYLKELRATDYFHWTEVLYEDANFIPPNGGGFWGYWSGKLVYNNWHINREYADLYKFTNPLWTAQHVSKIVVHCLVGRNNYPYGRCRVILSTHGQHYYGDYFSPNEPSEWFETVFTLNPFTNKEWTKDELDDIKAGISIEMLTTFGAVICDMEFIRVHYL